MQQAMIPHNAYNDKLLRPVFFPFPIPMKNAVEMFTPRYV